MSAAYDRISPFHRETVMYRHLLADDWAAIDQAFAAHRDPDSNGGAERHYHQLLARILTLAPA